MSCFPPAPLVSAHCVAARPHRLLQLMKFPGTLSLVAIFCLTSSAHAQWPWSKQKPKPRPAPVQRALPPTSPTPPPRPTPVPTPMVALPNYDEPTSVRLQIFLDNHNFGPGKIDGEMGEFFRKAL